MYQPYSYKDNNLFINSYKQALVSDLILDYEGPVYIYNLKDIENRYKHLQKSFNDKVDVHYALKANNNKEVVKKLISLGSGIDAVEQGLILQRQQSAHREAGYLMSDRVSEAAAKDGQGG